MKTTSTLAALVDRHSTPVDDHHDLTQIVPIHDGLQRQGDIIIVPVPATEDTYDECSRVPSDGVPLVRGENGGHTHLLLADGPVMACMRGPSESSLAVALVVVPDGATAYVAHPEHGYMGVGPGVYEVRRQREMADVIRVVAD